MRRGGRVSEGCIFKGRMVSLSPDIFGLFDDNLHDALEARKRRRESLALKGSVEAQVTEAAASVGGSVGAATDEYGAKLPADTYDGDAHLRTLNALLKEVDRRGYERSSQQLEFHENFIMATARVLYKDDWGLSRPEICAKNKWDLGFGGEVVRPRHVCSCPLFCPSHYCARVDR